MHSVAIALAHSVEHDGPKALHISRDLIRYLNHNQRSPVFAPWFSREGIVQQQLMILQRYTGLAVCSIGSFETLIHARKA